MRAWMFVSKQFEHQGLHVLHQALAQKEPHRQFWARRLPDEHLMATMYLHTMILVESDLCIAHGSISSPITGWHCQQCREHRGTEWEKGGALWFGGGRGRRPDIEGT